ncbi:MAG: hypothetical protein WC683_08580 [bacterium]
MSEAEDALALHIRAAGLPEPVREHRFCERRWRLDFAWPDKMVAVEVEGGRWVGGRHTSPIGFGKDCEKYSEAAARGWRIVRVTPEMIEDGTALGYIERALGGEHE